MSTGLAFVVVFVTMLLTGFFAGSETAVVSCSKIRLRHRAQRGSLRARILEKLLGSPERFFSVVLVGTNISVIVCTAAATALAVSFFGGSGAAVATAVMTPLILICCEVIPKAAFLYHADIISLNVSLPLKLFDYILMPIVIPMTLLARLVLMVSGAAQKRFNLLSTREELIYLYRGKKKESPAERRERLIIDRVFHFGSVLVGELMIPWDRVVSVPVNASVEEAIEEANRHTFSRFPVVAPRDGRVVGIISLFDLLGLDGGEKLGSVMHPPFFAKDGEPATKLLLRMKEEALHMAVVENVRGEALGIITLENILESVVGDIQDEYG